MTRSRQAVGWLTCVFLIGFISSENCHAANKHTRPMQLPIRIFITGAENLGDVVLVVYKDGAFKDGILVDPKAPDVLESGAVRLPQHLPAGPALSLMAVPRALAEQCEDPPDPAWLSKPSLGVVRVNGVIHYYPVEKWMSSHTYQLTKTGTGQWELRLMYYPEILEPYPEETPGGAETLPEEQGAAPMGGGLLRWLALAGAVTLIGGTVVWAIIRRNQHRNLPD